MTISSYLKRNRSLVLWLLLMAISLLLIPTVSCADNTVSLKVEVVSAEPGAEVNVPITILSNSGLASLKFQVVYDDSVLTLNDITFPRRTGTYTSAPEPYSANQTINFVSPLSLFTETGTFANLSFSVDENAELDSNSVITIVFDEDDIFDMVFNYVPLVASDGTVRITDNTQGSMAVLPQTVTVIEEEAFMNTSFYYVVLPETVTTIGSNAFANCTNLKYIYIPESTTRIADNAFLNVTGLTIYGKSGSYAEFFANKNGYIFQEQ